MVDKYLTLYHINIETWEHKFKIEAVKDHKCKSPAF